MRTSSGSRKRFGKKGTLGSLVAARNQPNTLPYCQGPASWCGLCAVAARSIKNALMLKQGRQISRKRSSQSNSLADGRVYDRLEEETSQPPYLALSFSRPDLGVCRDRTVVFGQNGSTGEWVVMPSAFSLGTCWDRATTDDYALRKPSPARSGDD